MEPHTTYSIRSPDWHKSDALGNIMYVTPFAHAMAFYGLVDKDIGHLANYEAQYRYFPINFNGKYVNASHREGGDYILAWAYPEAEQFASLTSSYDLIYQTKNLRMFRAKRSDRPDLSLWSKTADGRLTVRFDMQPKNGVTAEGHHPINKDTKYVTGRFGWVTQFPRHERQGAKDITPRERDYVWDTDDAAFKLDLPNGTYRVVNYFCSAEGSVHEVGLFANGKRVIRRLVIPAGKEAAERSFTVTVTAGHLTQAIYTQRKSSARDNTHNHWVWSGFTVEQLLEGERREE